MKKFVSVLLAVCMLVTMCTVAAVSVNAATTREIKFTNSKNWSQVYVYYWGGSTVQWPGIQMTDAGTNDYGEKQVKADIPTDITNLIFTNNSGEQTNDLDYDANATGWYLTDQTNGKWNAATWTDAVTPAPETTAAPAQETTSAPVTGGHTITVGVIEYVMNEAATGYKVHYWNEGGLEGDADVTALNKTVKKAVGQNYWNNEAQTFTMFTATIPAEATGFIVNNGDRWFGEDGVVANSDTVYIFNYDGDRALYEKSGDTPVEDTTAKPAEDTTAAPVTGGHTITVGVIEYVMNEVATGYKVHYWNEGGLEGDADVTALNKTEKKAVGQEYWNNEPQTFTMFTAKIPAEATGYKVHNGDRWFGDDGVVATNDKVYIFNYDGDRALYEKSVEETTVEETTVEETTVEETTVKPDDDTEYYLFGFINGANYACEEDDANLGEYKFVNGKLTATFTQTSYVAVRDNKDGWFMTDGWQEGKTSVELLPTSQLGENADKLQVPANTEVTFTLTKTANGFTLSYTTGGASEETTVKPEDTTSGPVTDGHTITVGVIEYVMNEAATGYKVHYWNEGGLEGDADVTALNKTVKKAVGQNYWNNEAQNFTMFTATIPAEATGFIVNNGDRWFGEDGVVADADTVYIFNYDGDRALYEKSGDTPVEETTVTPVTDGTTITVGVIEYVMNEAATGYQVHYWNEGGLEGDADVTALNKTEKKAVGQEYWNNEPQTFTMFTAKIPAEATGYKVHNGDRWFGDDGVVATNDKVYIFNYDGDRALYEKSVEETTVEETTVEETTVEETTVKPDDDTEYYLFGFINGANYACEEDAANLGEYKFVNGKLTATFTQTSYVAVRDNKDGWFMTDGWQEGKTSVELLPTSQLGQDADKLQVPANTEVTFTLTKTDNGFTLSYTVVEETTAEETTVEETTVEETTIEETTVEETTVEETTVEETTVEETTEPVVLDEVLVGDVIGHGRVNIQDVTRLQRFVAHFKDANITNTKRLKAADTNGDGKINIRDVTEIQRYLAKIPTKYVGTKQMR